MQFGNGFGGLDYSKFASYSKFDFSVITSIETELAKKLSPAGILESVTDKITDPDFLKETAISVISKQGIFNDDIETPFKITEQIVKEVGSKGLDGLTSHLNINLSQFSSFKNLFSTKQVVIDQLIEIQNFIKKMDDLYIKISTEKKSAIKTAREKRAKEYKQIKLNEAKKNSTEATKTS